MAGAMGEIGAVRGESCQQWPFGLYYSGAGCFTGDITVISVLDDLSCVHVTSKSVALFKLVEIGET